jgi:hypothetical protein
MRNSPGIFTGIQYMKKQVSKAPGAPKRGASQKGQPRQRLRASVQQRPQRFEPRIAGSGKAFNSLQKQQSVAAAYSTGQSSQPPRINATRDSARIVHRELVASVIGTTAFTVLSQLSLNPGIAATFPWLATQAQSWEQYHFNKLKFCYYTRTGSTTPGSVQLIPDYDAADAPPASEQIASSYEDVSEDVPWKDIECDLRQQAMHPMGPKKFIRSAALAANLDIKTYDVGTLFVGTLDGTAVNWGKLWVEYDVTLYSPQLNPAGSGSQLSQHFAGASNPTPTTANILGAAPVSTGSNLVSVAGSVVTFNQAGRFLLVYMGGGASDTQTGAPAISASGSFVTTYGLNGTGEETTGSGTAAMIQSMLLNAVVGTTVTFNNTVVAGTFADLIVSAVPSSQA